MKRLIRNHCLILSLLPYKPLIFIIVANIIPSTKFEVANYSSQLSRWKQHLISNLYWKLNYKIILFIYICSNYRIFSRGTRRWAPPWSSGSVLNHRSLPPVFESRRGHIWRVFHIWLRFIAFGSSSAHLAYHVHTSGRKTTIIINHHHRGTSSVGDYEDTVDNDEEEHDDDDDIDFKSILHSSLNSDTIKNNSK